MSILFFRLFQSKTVYYFVKPKINKFTLNADTVHAWPTSSLSPTRLRSTTAKSCPLSTTGFGCGFCTAVGQASTRSPC